MSLSQQTRERQISIFKQSLRFQESAAGLVVQRIPASYLKRILKPLVDARKAGAVKSPKSLNPDPTDPVTSAIYDFDNHFKECRQKAVDMLSSVEAIADEYETDGASGHGCLLLAWKTDYDACTKKLCGPKLVGAMTLYKFKRSENFSTHGEGISEIDARVLGGEEEGRQNLFRRNIMYIDALCAKGGKGVGRVMVLHAYRYALMKKCTGIVSLSFSSKANTPPESYKIFTDFGFEPLIPNATFHPSIKNMYGTWFLMNLDTVTFNAVLESAIHICTRKGFTENTKSNLIWRCPN